MTPLRRLSVAVLSAVLLFVVAACGGEAKPGYGDDTVSGFDGVEVGGEFGQPPTLSWKSVIAYPDGVETKTLIEGEGEEIGEGDQVDGRLYIGNGTTLEKEWLYRTGMQGGGDTETFSAETGPVFKKMLDGARVGDRIEAIAPSTDVFGEAGRADIGIGTRDTLVLVLDVVENAGPDPATIKPKDVPAEEMPKVVEQNGKPSALDFTGVAKPNGDLRRTVLKEGDGEEIKADSSVNVRYLGQVYGGDKPFDSNQTGEGIPADLGGGTNAVVQGWTNGLTGTTVGSRVLLEIPPVLGYGDQGRGDIKGTDTMFFVLDVVSMR